MIHLTTTWASRKDCTTQQGERDREASRVARKERNQEEKGWGEERESGNGWRGDVWEWKRDACQKENRGKDSVNFCRERA